MASTINASTTGGGGVITTADASGVLNLQSNGVTMASISPSGFNLGSDTPSNATALSPYTGFKNRIINGAMMIDQRNAGASVTPSTSADTYTVDRWVYTGSATSKCSIQQSSTAPAGYKNSVLITSLSAYTPSASDYILYSQFIEGLNTYDLGFGTADASTITFSFWVRSSLTGTFGGAIRNSAFNRSYPFSYTISSANTWEQKTITIAGDTTGTWLTTNGVGLRVNFDLGSGSNFKGTTNTWAGANYLGVTGATNLVSTNGATFYITGVQLEKGSTATSFEYRPYGTELALCQRYYYQISRLNWAVSSSSNGDSIVASIPFPVTMRTDPTLTNDYVNGVYDSAGPAAGKWCFNKPYVSNSTKTGTITAGATLLTYGAEVYYYGATFSPAPTGFNTPDTTLAMKFSAEL